MPSKVFFTSMKCSFTESLLNKIKKILNKCGIDKLYGKYDLTAIKIHFGELGNASFIRPIYLRPVIEILKRLGTKPFLTDTNTLYSGMRTNACDHIENACLNGFGWGTLQTPIIIADGLKGENFCNIPIKNGILLKEAKIAGSIAKADKLLVVSHFKGHHLAGFGGALKNTAMGSASREGKLEMHSDTNPQIKGDKCTACGRCKNACNAGAITISKTASITNECTGCAACISQCPEKAIYIDYNKSGSCLQKKIAEYASAVHNHFNTTPIYLNILTSITPDCDCRLGSGAPVVPDIGFAASCNPAALDKACLDLCIKIAGKNIFTENKFYTNTDEIFNHWEQLGEKSDYELIIIDRHSALS